MSALRLHFCKLVASPSIHEATIHVMHRRAWHGIGIGRPLFEAEVSAKDPLWDGRGLGRSAANSQSYCYGGHHHTQGHLPEGLVLA